MGALDFISKIISPEQALALLNNMSDTDLEKALRDLEPRLSPSKFNAFLQVMSEGVARRYPKVR